MKNIKNKTFYQRLSTIFSDIGQVFLATMIIPFFTNKNYTSAYFAMLVASACWAISLKLSRRQSEWQNNGIFDYHYSCDYGCVDVLPQQKKKKGQREMSLMPFNLVGAILALLGMILYLWLESKEWWKMYNANIFPFPSFPRFFCHSRASGNSVRTGSRIKCGMTGGDGSPIRSGMTGGNGSRIKCGMTQGNQVENDNLRKCFTDCHCEDPPAGGDKAISAKIIWDYHGYCLAKTDESWLKVTKSASRNYSSN